MKRTLFFLAFLLPLTAWAQVEVTTMRTNGLENPMGISPQQTPVLSWIVSSQSDNALQSAYEVITQKVISQVRVVLNESLDNLTLSYKEKP